MVFRAKEHVGSARNSASLRNGASIIAICAFAAATPAWAQDTQTNPPPTTTQPVAGAGQVQGTANGSNAVSNSTNPRAGQGGAIIITGIRQSLRNSQEIKRNSDTVVDAITAQDIGALPDRSVTEALQRVPGVAINRFSGASDPDHFSVEGSGVTIRGLTFVASEFNGRDTFSTGVYGQGINFQDVPAELLGSVEVYKEETADRLEGGLSGTVNMNLRLPFDNKGFHVGYDLEANYGDLDKKWSPVGSLLASDTWDTGIGRIGILGAVSYSRLFSRSDSIRVSNFQTRDGSYTNNNSSGTPSGICRQPLPTTTDTQGFPTSIPEAGNFSPCYGTPPAGANGFADWLQGAYYAPVGGQYQTETHDRKRRGIAAAAQWQSSDRRALLTAQFLNSKATESWGEHTMGVGSDLSEYNTYPLGCQQNGNGLQGRPRAECRVNSAGNFFFGNNAQGNGYNPLAGQSFPNYQYDSNNMFENGYITLPGTGWRTSDSGSSTTRVPTGGMQQSLDSRQVQDSNVVQDAALNLKFSPTRHWDINLDAQYVKAKHDTLDMEISSSNFADQQVNLTSQYPIVVEHKPNTLSATWAAPNPAMAADTDAQYFADPRFTFWRNAMDHIEHSRGHEWAFAGDVAYNFLDTVPFLRQFKFGARYADREQDIKYTTYNWGSLSEVWSGSGPAIFLDQVGVPQGAVQTYNWNGFFRGDTQAPPPALFYGGNLTDDYAQAIAFARMVQAAEQAACKCTSTTSWNPLAQRPGVVAGTPFLPSEIQPVSQKTDDAYAMLRFGQDEPIFGNVRLDGNIGVRYVRDKLTSSGAFQTNTLATSVALPFSQRCVQQGPPPGSPPGTPPPALPGICNIGPAAYAQLQQFAAGGLTPVPNTATNKYSYWLPSLNLKFALSRDLILRFAASKDFARPSLADIRNFLNIGFDQSSNTLTATAGNPLLKPITSNNYDATVEWYFGGSRVGSLTFDVFYKSIKNYIFQQVVGRDITIGGVTQPVAIRGPANFTGSGKVKGFEISYTQTFDFLPEYLNGLGISANYAYVKSKGVPNSFLNGGAPTSIPPIGSGFTLPLAQLSKHTINIEPFYEKGPISVRLAYNWRSKFLLTESDVIFPYFPIFQRAYGTLDASAFYQLTPFMKIGIQAQNLTNSVTKTDQMFTTGGLLGPRSQVMQDRRYSFIVRGTFGGSTTAPPPPPPPPLPPPPPETQTCPDGSVVAITATCPAPPPPPPPPPAAKPERG
ncbi:MAG TPA: TonB-dependent receptor [Bradyrhizobium sp.]|uniref:TonB-dependent receptor n=1 Tax=Bradyrhizobium sp. TaxID=376 RepID=UPI002B4812BC|nr:TonB-dependent receptor [Bradyrhizobium sp.]HKO71914.1 TonB-dependent receptor [Bradyrhizobium sp.]